MSKSSDPVRRFRNDAFEAAAPALADHAQAIRSLGKRVLSDILEIGERLANARQLIGRGHWSAWLKTEFGWSDETARRFINVFKLAKSHTVLDLDLSLGALYVLAAPSTPKEIREEILARCQEGESFSRAGVQRVVSEARAVNVPVTSSVVQLSVPYYVTRAEAVEGAVDTPVRLIPPEPATTVFVRLDGEFADAQRLIIAIEAYGASALSSSKKLALQKAAMVLGRDRAAIRRCIDIITAAIGDD